MQGRGEALGEGREVPGRRLCAGRGQVLCHFKFLCTSYVMNSQLTPVVPPVLRRGQQDGPGGHGAQGREKALREGRQVPGRRQGAGEFVMFFKLC